MSKGTTIKQALTKWEEENNASAAEADVIELQFQWPPIEKMDNTLGTLTECKKLSLSTNCIGAISGLANMKQLKVLSLSRNYIKSLMGVEVLADSLTELWISYNLIERTRGISALRKLKVLYMAHNVVKEWPEFTRLQDCPLLDDVIFIGNPLSEELEETEWRRMAVKKLPQLKKLDGDPVIVEIEEEPPPAPAPQGEAEAPPGEEAPAEGEQLPAEGEQPPKPEEGGEQPPPPTDEAEQPPPPTEGEPPEA